MDKMKSNIQESFDHIRKALDFREKLLLRQVQVLEQNQIASHLTREIQFIPENEVNLLHLIRIFGKFNVNKFNVSNTDFFLSNEDYICPQDDHVLINKQLVDTTTLTTAADVVQATAPSVERVDENANNINESLINLILNESKELIEKSKLTTKPKSHKRGADKELTCETNTKEGRHGNKKMQIVGDIPVVVRPAAAAVASTKSSKTSSLATTVSGGGTTATTAHNSSSGNSGSGPAPADKSTSSSTTFPSKKKFSSLKNISNLTLNSGTLNLRNVANLTINTNCTNGRPTAITTSTTEYDVQAVACDFYHRLIRENKLLQQANRSCCNQISDKLSVAKSGAHETSVSPVPSVGTSSTTFKEFSSGMERKLLEKMDHYNRFECAEGGQVIDSNGNSTATPMERPKQIQHWLKQIINESELEPMQSTELLEFKRT